MNESEEAAVRARVRAARSRARAGGRGTVVLSEPVSLDEDFDPPVIVKTADEAAEISAAISGNIIFAGLDTDQRSVLIGAMERREFSAGETIIRQGDAGDYFYVQVSGTCQVLVNGAVVLETSAGQSFGELALLYDSPRAATVVVAGSDPVVTWAIDRRTFKHAVVATAIAKRRRFGAAVDRVPLLQGLPPNERGAILDCLLPVEAAPGAVLVAEGDTDADRFYIVDDGELMAVRLARDRGVVEHAAECPGTWCECVCVCVCVGGREQSTLSRSCRCVAEAVFWRRSACQECSARGVTQRACPSAAWLCQRCGGVCCRRWCCGCRRCRATMLPWLVTLLSPLQCDDASAARSTRPLSAVRPARASGPGTSSASVPSSPASRGPPPSRLCSRAGCWRWTGPPSSGCWGRFP